MADFVSDSAASRSTNPYEGDVFMYNGIPFIVTWDESRKELVGVDPFTGETVPFAGAD